MFCFNYGLSARDAAEIGAVDDSGGFRMAIWDDGEIGTAIQLLSVWRTSMVMVAMSGGQVDGSMG